VLGNTPAPSTSVDVCFHDGFGLNSNVTIRGGDGALLVAGEAFSWRPWAARGDGQMTILNKKGQVEFSKEAFGVLDLLWPRPGATLPAQIHCLFWGGKLTRIQISSLSVWARRSGL
jgi:hypothetical protein